MKKTSILFTLLLTAAVLFSSSICAYASSEYYINDYRVDMVVNEDNSIDVTEHITANFNVSKHGIYRYIPIKNEIIRADGTQLTQRAKVRYLEVNENYETSVKDGYYVIQIGDEDITHTGKMDYVISYTYEIGRDLNEGFDELYFNIIGDGWDTFSNNVSFSITMPKDFDQSKLGFSKGKYGTIGNDNNVKYTINGNKITGSVVGTLKANEALTVRLELDDNYFTFDYTAYYFKLAMLIAIPLLALIIAIALWYKFGRDKKVVEVVEFYPPENMNSAEVAMWNKGLISDQDTIGILLELANEGYVSINEKPSANGAKNGVSYTIKKERSQYTGKDKQKQKFFSGLFKGKKTSVTIDELENSFYETANSISSEINLMRNKVFNSKSLLLRAIGWVFSIIAGALSVVFCVSMLGGKEKYICCVIGVLIAVAAFIVSCFIRKRTDEGHLYKQQISGFKTFLETAEKERLEALVEESPTYFYNILPFAYVLGVSEKWIKNFEGIAMEPPRWYYGYDYHPMTMYYFMHHAMPQAASKMTTHPQSSGTGGGSFGGGGGGFAGGGFGGGGGGSW